MRAIGVHEDVLVLSSRVWQTTCTVVRSGEEGFLIDSPVYPDELELLPALLEQAGFPCSGLLATHGDWDHLLGRLAFPGAAVGVCESTAARLTAQLGAPQRDLRAFDERHYVARAKPLALGKLEALPVPGYCGIGERELELHPADGHTDDGMAVLVPWAGVLVCGDYLSPLEIPLVEGSPAAYLATLGRLEGLLDRVHTVVPGHGEVLDAARARTILREDRAYVELLASGGAPTLPLGRRTAEQRSLHHENLARR